MLVLACTSSLRSLLNECLSWNDLTSYRRLESVSPLLHQRTFYCNLDISFCRHWLGCLRGSVLHSVFVCRTGPFCQHSTSWTLSSQSQTVASTLVHHFSWSHVLALVSPFAWSVAELIQLVACVMRLYPPMIWLHSRLTMTVGSRCNLH